MHSSYLISILVLLLFQSVRGKQNAAFDKNYSDRLTEPSNQQSSLEPNDRANRATANRFIATDASDWQAPHETSHLAANKHYAASRFRRSSGDDSAETGPTLNSGTVPEDNEAKKPINFLRLYFCGAGYQNCMYDDRLNNIKMQNDFLKKFPRMAEITVPTNYLDWKSKQLSLPFDIKGLNGRRDQAFAAEEPHYLLVRSDDANPRHLALLSGPETMDDPFIPQRGRRQSNAQTYDDPFYPMRGRRADAQAWDDPFFPMRGRRADNAWDDPFVPMRGRRRQKDSGKRAKAQPWDDPFIPMRGRKSKSLSYDDPFIPMRGRKSDDDDDTFIPMRGRRSIQSKAQRKRSLLASTGTFNAVYTPTEEVIVKLNGVQDNLNAHSLPARLAGQKGKLQEATNSPLKHQQHQKKSYFLLDDFATNPDDGDNGLMDDYTNYYVEPAQQMSHRRVSEGWMKSSRDLSQKRDAGNLARGSATSVLF